MKAAEIAERAALAKATKPAKCSERASCGPLAHAIKFTRTSGRGQVAGLGVGIVFSAERNTKPHGRTLYFTKDIAIAINFCPFCGAKVGT